MITTNRLEALRPVEDKPEASDLVRNILKNVTDKLSDILKSSSNGAAAPEIRTRENSSPIEQALSVVWSGISELKRISFQQSIQVDVEVQQLINAFNYLTDADLIYLTRKQHVDNSSKSPTPYPLRGQLEAVAATAAVLKRSFPYLNPDPNSKVVSPATEKSANQRTESNNVSQLVVYWWHALSQLAQENYNAFNRHRNSRRPRSDGGSTKLGPVTHSNN
jgi:hypothetical protein